MQTQNILSLRLNILEIKQLLCEGGAQKEPYMVNVDQEVVKANY